MSKLLARPKQTHTIDSPARFQKFNLMENPFPSEPAVNKESKDKRINGEIYELEIRRKEYSQIEQVFLVKPQTDPNHIRLGYIMDTSYIGRGNGKSAFLVQLNHKINNQYCLDISNGTNKCFSLIIQPEPGGRTKTFPLFVDLIFQSIINSNIIKNSLAILRLNALLALYNKADLVDDDEKLISSLSDPKWYDKNNYDLNKISKYIVENPDLGDLPSDFPLVREQRSLLREFITEDHFKDHYFKILRKPKERFDFVFTHLVKFFMASTFNGAYVLVDDFERIPDFQSARQKKDFALELRSCLFDGMYYNARVGFYTFILVLHAGVPRLIADAWSESGMETRSPISRHESPHLVPFEKLTQEYALMLLSKYLDEYRIEETDMKNLFPFTEGAINAIGAYSEYNASKMLKMAYDALDRASTINDIRQIDADFVEKLFGTSGGLELEDTQTIDTAESTDLIGKAKGSDS